MDNQRDGFNDSYNKSTERGINYSQEDMTPNHG